MRRCTKAYEYYATNGFSVWLKKSNKMVWIKKKCKELLDAHYKTANMWTRCNQSPTCKCHRLNPKIHCKAAKETSLNSVHMFATKERVITLLNTDLSNKPTNVNRNMRKGEERANTVHVQTYRENQINESYLSSLIIKHFIVANCHSGHIDYHKHHLSILTGGYIGMLLWSFSKACEQTHRLVRPQFAHSFHHYILWKKKYRKQIYAGHKFQSWFNSVLLVCFSFAVTICIHVFHCVFISV